MRSTSVAFGMALSMGAIAQESVPALKGADDAGRRLYQQGFQRSVAADTTVYEMDAVDEAPRHPAGDDTLLHQLAEAAGCDATPLDEGCTMFTVVLSMVVERDGRVAEVRTEGGACAALEARTRCAVQGLPPFVPARKAGRAVRCRMWVPVHYTPR